MLCVTIENLSSSLSSEARTFLLNEDETAKKAFIENLKDIRGVFNGNVTKNEATTRNFINPFIIKAVSRLQTIYPTMFLAVEQAFSGSRGFGNLDYAVFFSTFAILVTEAKQYAIMAGLTQNLVQLHTASEVSKFCCLILEFVYSVQLCSSNLILSLLRNLSVSMMTVLSCLQFMELWQLEGHGYLFVGKAHQKIPL